MTCPRCGSENPDGAVFCNTCGTALGEAPDTVVLPPAATGTGPEPGTTPLATGAGDGTADDIGPALAPFDRPHQPGAARRVLTDGWGSAAAWAAGAFAAMLLLGEGLAALIYAASPNGPSLVDAGRLGGLLTYALQRVGISASVKDVPIPSDPTLGAGAGQTVSATVVFAFGLLLGTILLAWILYRAGKAQGVRAGGSAWLRGLAALKVAPVYAAIAGVVALGFAAFPLTETFQGLPGLPAGGAVKLHPDVLGAVLWPLVIAALAAFAGGVSTASKEGWRRPGYEAPALGALRGGLAMTAWGVVLGFVGIQVLAWTHLDAAVPFNPKFFSGLFNGGVLSGAAGLAFALMIVPNLGALALAPAMGGTLGVYGGGVSFALLSYLNFPTGFNPEVLSSLGLGSTGLSPDQIITSRTAPPVYWLFLLVPVLATLLGGRSAARRARAATAGEGAVAGGLAGVVYAALVVLLAVMAGVGVHASAAFSRFSAHVGPEYVPVALLALAWGVIGGALGGMFTGRRAEPAVAPPGSPDAQAAFGFTDGDASPATSHIPPAPGLEPESEPPADPPATT